MIQDPAFTHDTLISETDRFGKILFANDAFCDVSGYSRNELVGSPHSIIRHPDMPKGLFQIMWETIKKGDVFRGVIKNLAKDGSPYWVYATILPVANHAADIEKYVGGRYLIEDAVKAQSMFDEQAMRWRI